jgi:hypothetical protein
MAFVLWAAAKLSDLDALDGNCDALLQLAAAMRRTDPAAT